MPVRIYALAKELKMDSKALVEVCNKAGVSGKGSALASLTDDELTKVKAYMAGGDKPPKRTASPTTTTAAAPTAATPTAATPTAAAPTAAAPTAAGAAATREPSDRPVSRGDYIAPGGGAMGKPPVIGTPSPGAPSKKKPTARQTADKKGPVIKLAAIPKAEQPKPVVAAVDEPTQKPIMTLPVDTIRKAKEGSTAPLKQFTRHQDKKRKPTESADTAPPSPDKFKGRGNERRGGAKTGGEKTGAVEGDGKGKRRKGLAGMASTRQARQSTARGRRPSGGRQTGPMRRRSRLTRKGTNTAAPRKGTVTLELPCSIRSFSEATGIPTANIQRALMAMGTMATINSELDFETADMLALDAGVEIELKQAASLEETTLGELENLADAPGDLVARPPVVTFLGHVDHGKTSLLDHILGINVVDGEAGGITQHIRAYAIDKDGRTISFVDTPGHEAFTEMRARGANVTDIAVLVVAADDGVMPQTEEAISHARAAEVPIIVALNKIDLPGADINRAMQDLSTHELLPTEWGGDVEVIKTSAIAGDGIDDLLETILLTAEIHEYQANPKRGAIGTCLEAQQEGGRGVVAKVIVQNGTLKVGDVVVCGAAHGRVKAMYDTLATRKKITAAGPSVPVNISGLNIAPEAGDAFHVLDDIAKAREIAEHRSNRSRQQSLSGYTPRISFEEFQRRLEEGVLGNEEEAVTLNIILRADVRGSIEAIEKELTKLEHPEVQVKLMQATVGGITVADVTLADASDAVIVGFNVIPDENARAMADERGVEIRRYDIIYKVTEDIKALLEGKLKPEERINDLGRALVQQTFTISRVGTVAGCRVLAGTIERNCRIRVNRDGRGIGDYPLDSLRREKDDVKEAREGFECGIKLSGFNDLKEGDILEAYKIEEFARTL